MFWPQNCCMALISSPLIAITGFSSTCCSKHNVPGKDEKGGDRDRREGQTVQWMGKNSQCQVYTDMGSCKNMPLLITHCRQLLTIWGFNLHPVLFNGEGDSYMLKSNTWNVSTKLKVNHTGLCVCVDKQLTFFTIFHGSILLLVCEKTPKTPWSQKYTTQNKTYIIMVLLITCKISCIWLLLFQFSLVLFSFKRQKKILNSHKPLL